MRFFVGVVVFFLLVACSTPYQSSGMTGGLTESEIEENTYLIQFSGNGFTSRSKASAMSLVRAAELTLDSGFSHFKVLNAGSDTSRTMVSGVNITFPSSELVVRFTADTDDEEAIYAMDIIKSHGSKVKYKGKYATQ